MISGNFRRLALVTVTILSTLSLQSCKTVETDGPQSCFGNVRCILANRESNFLSTVSVDIDSLQAMRIHYAISEDISKQWQSPDNGVPANKYSIYAFVLPVSWTETLYALRHGLDYYQYEYMIPGDDDIENQLKQWLDEMNPKFRTWVNMKEYPLWSDKQGEYRTEECMSISIRSAAPLFGRPALSEISDMFKIVSWHEEEGQWLNGPFLITYDKKFLGIIKEDISIEEYLSHRPMVQPAFLFKMLDTPSELDEVDSLETDFIVEIGLGNGKQLKDTAHVKLLMPEAIEEK